MYTPIDDFLKNYAQSGIIRAHMPGHKGLYPYDITEICGADDLFSACGIIARSEQKATEMFGSYKTVYSCEGSTLCIQTMLAVLAEVCGRKVIAARNCHRAFLNAAALLDLDVHWLYPEYSDSYLSGRITPLSVRNALESCPDTDFVYITTPDYLGKLTALDEIADICHAHGAKLAVDNAHGAYLRFIYENGTPLHPLFHGADIVCDSAHKTLPVLTGGAYLHIADKTLECCDGYIKQMMSVFGSSSPSYMIMQSLDKVDPAVCEEYFKKMQQCSCRAKEIISTKYAVEDTECGKITINAARSGCDGDQLADRLREKGAECEYSDHTHVVLMITGLSPENIEKLTDILMDIDITNESNDRISPVFTPYIHERAMSVRDAFMAKSEIISVDDALGRVCAKPVTMCPPGVALIVGGEFFCKEDIFFLKNYGNLTANVVK